MKDSPGPKKKRPFSMLLFSKQMSEVFLQNRREATQKLLEGTVSQRGWLPREMDRGSTSTHLWILNQQAYK